MSPAFVVTDDPLVGRRAPGTARSSYFFITAEILCRSAETIFRAADIKGTFTARTPLSAPSGIALALGVTVGNAVLAGTVVWAHATDLGTINTKFSGKETGLKQATVEN